MIEVNIDITITFLLTSIFFSTLGLQNPYLVLMDDNITNCKVHADVLGFDAISSYGIVWGGTVQVYKDYLIL